MSIGMYWGSHRFWPLLIYNHIHIHKLFLKHKEGGLRRSSDISSSPAGEVNRTDIHILHSWDWVGAMDWISVDICRTFSGGAGSKKLKYVAYVFPSVVASIWGCTGVGHRSSLRPAQEERVSLTDDSTETDSVRRVTEWTNLSLTASLR